MSRTVHVTDHALIRYMERVLKLDMAGIRAEIGARAATGALAGADSVTVDGIVYQFGLRDHRTAVVTVYRDEPGTRPPPPLRQPTPANRSKRWHIHRRKKR